MTCFEDGPVGGPTLVPGLTGVVQLAGGVTMPLDITDAGLATI